VHKVGHRVCLARLQLGHGRGRHHPEHAAQLERGIDAVTCRLGHGRGLLLRSKHAAQLERGIDAVTCRLPDVELRVSLAIGSQGEEEAELRDAVENLVGLADASEHVEGRASRPEVDRG